MTHLLTRAEVAKWLGVSPAWVSDQVRAGTIPFVRLSPKVVRFRAEDLASYIDKHKGGRCDSSNDATADAPCGHPARTTGMPDSRPAVSSSVSRREREIEQELRSKLHGSGSRSARPALLVVNGPPSRK